MMMKHNSAFCQQKDINEYTYNIMFISFITLNICPILLRYTKQRVKFQCHEPDGSPFLKFIKIMLTFHCISNQTLDIWKKNYFQLLTKKLVSLVK